MKTNKKIILCNYDEFEFEVEYEHIPGFAGSSVEPFQPVEEEAIEFDLVPTKKFDTFEDIVRLVVTFEEYKDLSHEEHSLSGDEDEEQSLYFLFVNEQAQKLVNHCLELCWKDYRKEKAFWEEVEIESKIDRRKGD